MIRMVDRVLGQLSLADGLVWSDVTELDQISRVIDWVPIKALLGQRSGPGRGNISYPAEALLRCLLLGVWNNLSDPSLEAQLRDRLSFRRFAGFSLSDPTPDHSTLWRFREELKCDGLIDRVFYEITRQLEQKGLIVKRGTLIDASFMQAAARPPAKPKKGEEATARPSADGEARWGRKGNKTVFGYKVHNGVDDAHTLIRRMDFTDVSVTDTEPADGLIIGDEKAAYGDQAYYTHARHARLKQASIKDRLMHRANKHHPLTPRQKQRNRLISKVRAAVERPFAVFKQRYGMRRLRFFNLATNRTQCMLAGCGYNLQRAAAVLFPKRKPA
ncbi:IS5 family transposase [Mesorhizobium sp. M2A.F.Ca.ET.046.02.1.1]|nr:IS5 family transposase [Mesorhizobium sp. M2A.F.Ca.ET.046.02.1.1]